MSQSGHIYHHPWGVQEKIPELLYALQEIGVQMYESGNHCAAHALCASVLNSPSSFTFQHSPSSEAETKCCYVSCNFPLWKWFGQYICNHVFSRAISEVDESISDSIADKMISNINVFHPSMIIISLGKLNCWLVITIECDGQFGSWE